MEILNKAFGTVEIRFLQSSF